MVLLSSVQVTHSWIETSTRCPRPDFSRWQIGHQGSRGRFGAALHNADGQADAHRRAINIAVETEVAPKGLQHQFAGWVVFERCAAAKRPDLSPYKCWVRGARMSVEMIGIFQTQPLEVRNHDVSGAGEGSKPMQTVGAVEIERDAALADVEREPERIDMLAVRQRHSRRLRPRRLATASARS